MDRNELTQLLPRQLSSHDYIVILGNLQIPLESDDFTNEQAKEILMAAQDIVHPGLAHVRKTLKEVQELYAKYNVQEFLIVRHATVIGTKEILHVEVAHSGIRVMLFEVLPLSSDYGRDISYKLQHYDTLGIRQARNLAGSVVAAANMDIVNREAGSAQTFTLEDLINELPRSVKLGEMLGVIKAERKFTAERIKALVDHITTISGY